MDQPAPRTLTADLLRATPLPDLDEGDKEARGRVLVVGGDREQPGGALLAGEAALRAGAGKLQIATGLGVAAALSLAIPEARVFGLPETDVGSIDPRAAATLEPRVAACAAVVVGPGMLDHEAAAALAGALLRSPGEAPVLLDAAALSAAKRREADPDAGRRAAILTPHAGEMARLMEAAKEDVEADPLAFAREAASRFAATVVLKGSVTYVAVPSGEAWVFRGGHVGLATSGSGDVLSGLIGGLLARGAAPAVAALWGVCAHAEAGRRLGRRFGPVGFLAREIAAEVPATLAGLVG